MSKIIPIIQKKGDQIIVKPQKNFWDLAGSLNTGVTLSDKELSDARKKFSKEWSDEK